MKIKKQRFVLMIIFVFLIGFGLFLGSRNLMYLIKHPAEAFQVLQVSVGERLSGENGATNVLLIGNNARDADNPLSLGTAAGQADILIVAHIDPSAHQVSLISIPRDTLIAMPGWKEPIPKIKSAFELGLQQSPEEGPKLAMEYASKLTGLPIHHYIATDFKGFADAIDAVGGITINIPERLYDPEHSGADLQPGKQTLNGEQALAFIRIRQNAAGNDYRTDDFQRQNAELEVLNLLKEKLLSTGVSLSEIKKLQEAWKKDIATNLSPSALVGFGLETSGSKIDRVMLGSVQDSMDIADTPLPGVNQEGFLSGAYYDVLDSAEIGKKLARFGSKGASTGLPPMPNPNEINVRVIGAQSVAGQLEQAGFQVQWLGPNNGGTKIEVYYPQGQLMAGCRIARVLGTANALVAPAQRVSTITVYTP